MSRTFFLDEDSNPVLDSEGHFIFLQGVQSLAENIDQRLKLFKNKYFMNQEAGVPYIEDILKKPVDPGLVASILNAEILKHPEVTGIGEVEADLDRDLRIFHYRAVVKHIFSSESLIVEFSLS